MKKMLLIDGNSVLFRAFYSTIYGRPMKTGSGLYTNAVYGFALMINKAFELCHPDYVLVAFDKGKHTFRHDTYADYKGGRAKTPEELIPQFAIVREYCTVKGIPFFECDNYEADDIIGTISLRYPELQTEILTSDRDMLQLIDASTHVLLMKKGLSEMEDMSEEALMSSMGITPSQITDLKGLMGDSSDNLPGVPGVGEKTALKLLKEFKTVENLLMNTDRLKGKLKEKIVENQESALMCKKLATIYRQVPIELQPDDLKVQSNPSVEKAFYEKYEMKSFAAQIDLQQDGNQEVKKAECVERISENLLKPHAVVAFSDVGLGIHYENRTQIITLDHAKKDEKLCAFLADEQEKSTYDLKRALRSHHFELNGFTYDAMIAANLCDSACTSWSKAIEIFGLQEVDLEKINEKNFDTTMETVTQNIAQLVFMTQPRLKEQELESLFYDLEMPLLFVLFEMEEKGIRVDHDNLDMIAEETLQKVNALKDKIQHHAQKEFNVNSPKQLAEVLFDTLGLPSNKKRSTSIDVLRKLQGFHPIIDDLMEYRRYQKMYSTYAEGLKKYIQEDGKIHTIYNQCATQTGRLSSSEPNLQNISVKDEDAREIRRVFLPSENNVLISCDYSQVELRMLAHMAQETNMIAAFKSGLDIHTATAMELFELRQDEITGRERRQAKAINFGIVYGMSEFGLAEQLGISRFEAQNYIQKYFEKYPKIRSFMDGLVAKCEENGYVTTLLNRRRQIEEIHDKNYAIREFGKRAAMNAPIQGSAADLIKLAMLKIHQKMKEANVKSSMILQVHDELIFDVPLQEVEQMIQLIEEGMTHAMELSVPLVAECKVGKTWYEAK